MKDTFISSEGRIGRLVYIIRVVLLTVVAVLSTMKAIQYFDHWHHGNYSPLGPFVGIVVGLICALIIMMQFIKRLHDMDKPVYLSLLLLVPGVNILVLLYAAIAPSKS